MTDLSICAPAYDEAECIESVVREWLAVVDRDGLDAEIVVADDGSTDETGAILERLGVEDPRVRCVCTRKNAGYGHALRRAIGAARGDFIVTIDSDGQFDPSDIPRLVAHLHDGGFDLVTGFRRAKHDTPLRIAADRGLRVFVRALFGLRLRDPNCALKLFSRAWVEGAELTATGYPTPTEIVVRAHHDGLRIGEVGVGHRARAGGATKLRLARTAADAAGFLVGLRLRLWRS